MIAFVLSGGGNRGALQDGAIKALIGRSIYPGNALTVGWLVLTGQGSLHGRENFRRFVLAKLPPSVRRFKDLKVPCLVTATSLATGRLRQWGEGPNESLLDAILSSTSI